MNERCSDPCPGSCGLNAVCNVINHTPSCACQRGYQGNAFVRCEPVVIRKLILQRTEEILCLTHSVTEAEPETPKDLCYPYPCGQNTECSNGICSCVSDYIGNPMVSCRPECVLNSECSRGRACIKSKCADPCIGACGNEALCHVYNHSPMCSCLDGYTGNPQIACVRVESMASLFPFQNEELSESPVKPLAPAVAHDEDVCQPTPCGPNSRCESVRKQAVCACLSGYTGSPPACRPECMSVSDCPLSKTCLNERCIDPCPGMCGLNAECRVVNHNAICSCPRYYAGDAMTRCVPIAIGKPPMDDERVSPCVPTPCGPNSNCVVQNGNPSCSCLPEFNGLPPYCRPECTTNTECSNHLACVNKKCVDPCANACGQNAKCNVFSHTPMCECLDGMVGNPFLYCKPKVVVEMSKLSFIDENAITKLHIAVRHCSKLNFN